MTRNLNESLDEWRRLAQPSARSPGTAPQKAGLGVPDGTLQDWTGDCATAACAESTATASAKRMLRFTGSSILGAASAAFTRAGAAVGARPTAATLVWNAQSMHVGSIAALD